MPYFKTSQEWLDQSVALLEARPASTVITTRYSLKAASARPSGDDEDGDATAKPPRAALVIKTYDPVSGVTLKYRTTKAAEVSRLIGASLGRLGRSMAAVPPADEPMFDAQPEADDPKAAPASQPLQQQQQLPQQGGKKKKKGKK
ncbi:signal recognition particle 9 kDa protein-domain-containing protein [Dactylonectria estremocensis]|uniref:Signal recognition particle 9 kDa protein-domain-containing protein n=1 Tax=Dactylonectria estremocensis TaxID=1079267 RepID=A0A9P9E5P5_9HYPO|nr:signal recognition particle 9 kDa protein-domain-containing protein [Dactylonectria estremocensis]